LFDRCEHLLAAVSEFALSLREVDGVRILATSREPLHVDGEYVLRLGPLPEDDAIAFFERCARQANPDVRIGASDRELVRRLVNRLDAVPLALEFAARDLRDTPLAEVEANLDRARDAAAASPVDAAVASSYLLLSPEEKRVFRNVSVFPADCT